MKRSVKIVFHAALMIAGAAVGLALGFAFRSWKTSHSIILPMEHDGGKPEGQSRSGLNQQRQRRLKDDSPLTTQLEHDLTKASGVTRWLYWMEALEKAGAADFPRLTTLARGNPTALRFVASRWVEVAPRNLFDTILAERKSGQRPMEELREALFYEWPKRDPDAAIAAVNENKHSILSYWKFNIAYSVVQKDLERGIRLMSEWGATDTGFGTSGIAAVTKWTQANPRHAAEFMLDEPDSGTIRSTMETIGREWARIDPANAMAFVASRPGEPAGMLAAAALKQWAQGDLAQATDWLSAADARTRNRFSPAFVEVWAAQDPASALAWCQENLSGSAFAQAVAGVLKGTKDTASAALLVSGMDPSAARAEAAIAVAEKWFPGLASGQAVTPQAVQWLAGLDGDSIRRVLDKITWKWSTSDAKSMADFLLNVSSDQAPQHAYRVVAEELARKNPTEALEWAGRLPQQQALTAGGAAFAEWRSSQPDAATKWLNGLGVDDPRRQSFFESAIRALAYHPQGAEQFAAMNPTERAQARSAIEKMDIAVDRRTRLLEVLK